MCMGTWFFICLTHKSLEHSEWKILEINTAHHLISVSNMKAIDMTLELCYRVKDNSQEEVYNKIKKILSYLINSDTFRIKKFGA